MLRSGCGRWASEPTAEDLKDLAIGMVGHRRMLLKAIANLRTAPAVSAPDPAAGAAAERRQLCAAVARPGPDRGGV